MEEPTSDGICRCSCCVGLLYEYVDYFAVV